MCFFNFKKNNLSAFIGSVAGGVILAIILIIIIGILIRRYAFNRETLKYSYRILCLIIFQIGKYLHINQMVLGVLQLNLGRAVLRQITHMTTIDEDKRKRVNKIEWKIKI